MQAQSKALAPPAPRPLPRTARPTRVSDPLKCPRQVVTRAAGSRRAPESREEPPPPRTQCYKKGLVVGGLEAYGLDEDPVMKGLVEMPAGWLSGLCSSLADPKSLKEDPFCC